MMNTLDEKKLYEKLDSVSRLGFLNRYKEMPRFVKENLNPKMGLRPYQTEAFSRFFYYYSDYPEKKQPINLLFNMATGSGKTLIMAGLILYLYEKGYRNFLFFVNSTNIIEKTKANFLNNLDNKYLFNQKIIFNNKEIKITKVENFEGVNNDDINICFTTIHQLHADLSKQKENSITFEDFKNKKIVLIADEAHHGQVQTKQKKLFDKDEKPNWENTVLRVFNQNKENLLLEFTATMFTAKTGSKEDAIEKKYFDKVIFKYDLKAFREDKYSKDINILVSDADKKDRILLALILNQYRQDVAAKHGIELKPVILFKAQKTIEQSKENKDLFHKIIEKLSKREIEEMKKKTDIKDINKAFQFYDKEKISTDLLIQKLKTNFSENKCLSVNDEQEKENYQLVLNSLENKNNQIRVIFAVQKLNEGWDVLNLYDIVRIYEGQAGGGGYGGKVSPSTLSEAQLIGRGARYFPFKLKNKNEEEYKRKFDEDLENELRILEKLHFHSYKQSSYIAELNTALVNEGLIDNKTVEKELKLKGEFKKTIFYKEGKIYLNDAIENNYSYVNSFEDLGMTDKDFEYELFSFKGKITQALTDGSYDNLNVKKELKVISIKQIEKHIIFCAIARKEFFKFENLRRCFPNLKSIKDFVENKEYLATIKINFWGVKEDMIDLSNREKYLAVLKVLDEIENKLKGNLVDYRGSEEFLPKRISEVFKDKTIKIQQDTPRSDGQEEFLKDKEWYAFNANYGTNEEKACVELINRLIEENFRQFYDEIYLLRNELHFYIYSFNEGKTFSPDFVLFMRNKGGKRLTYQIFIEPKGKWLEEKDSWKQDFLLQIREKFSSKDFLKFVETSKYRIIGVPFYISVEENKFKDELLNSLE